MLSQISNGLKPVTYCKWNHTLTVFVELRTRRHLGRNLLHRVAGFAFYKAILQHKSSNPFRVQPFRHLDTFTVNRQCVKGTSRTNDHRGSVRVAYGKISSQRWRGYV